MGTKVSERDFGAKKSRSEKLMKRIRSVMTACDLRSFQLFDDTRWSLVMLRVVRGVW